MIQNQYNLLNREAEKEIMNTLKKIILPLFHFSAGSGIACR